jgi:signal transduction histidine kinase
MMLNMQKCILIRIITLTFIIIPSLIFGQGVSEIDSLSHVVRTALPKDEKMLCALYCRYASLLANGADSIKTKKYLMLGINLSEKLNLPECRLQAKTAVGHYYFITNGKKAQENYNEAISIAEHNQITYRDEYFQALMSLYKLNLTNNRATPASKIYASKLFNTKEKAARRHQVELYLLEGLEQFVMKNKAKGFELLYQGVELAAQEPKAKHGIYTVLNMMLLEEGRYQEAALILATYEERFSKFDSNAERYLRKFTQGYTQAMLENNELALFYFNEALKEAENMKDNDLIAQVLTYTAEVEIEMGNVNKAENLANRAFQALPDKQKQSRILFQIYKNFSAIALQKKEYQQAEKKAIEAENIANQIADNEAIVKILCLKGDIALEQGQNAMAISNYKKSIEIAKGLVKKWEDLELAYLGLAKAYRLSNNVAEADKALAFQQLYIDSININRNALFRNQFIETKQKNEQLQAQAQKITLLEKDKEIRFYFFFSIALLAALLLGYFLMQWRKQSVENKISRSMFNAVQQLQRIDNQMSKYQEKYGLNKEEVITLHQVVPSFSENPQQDLKLMEAIIRKLQRNSEQYQLNIEHHANTLKAFNQNIAHDIRRPLTIAEMSLNNIKKDLEAGKSNTVEKHIKNLDNTLHQMQGVLNGMLALAQIESFQITDETLDLTTLLNNVKANYEQELAQIGAVITVGTLPTLRADAYLIFQVFDNLINNAIKYRSNHRTLLINITSEPTEQHHCLIRFQDNGIGFDESKASYIFEPFKRLVEASEIEGTGIGLSIVKRILERYNAQITVKSKINIGTTFMIELPDNIVKS